MELKKLMFVIFIFGTPLYAQNIFSHSLISPHFSCKKNDLKSGEVSDCKLHPHATLDEAISDVTMFFARTQRQRQACGNYADWTLDQNDNVMYREKNGPCPLHPKSEGYGNYCDRDLEAIGKGDIQESARPRTLGCENNRKDGR